MHFCKAHTAALAAAFAIAAMVVCNAAQAKTRVVHTAEEMIQALESPNGLPIANEIVVRGTIVFHSAYKGTGNALPVIDTPFLNIHGGPDAALVAGAPGFRLAKLVEVNGGIGTEVVFRNLEIRGFDSPGNGGAILVRGGSLLVDGVTFRENSAEGHGGAIFGRSAWLGSRENKFVQNTANAGCAIALEFGSALFIRNVFLGQCQQGLIRVVDASIEMESNTLVARGGRALTFKSLPSDSSNTISLSGNVFVQPDGSAKALCAFLSDSGEGNVIVVSQGDNVATDSSCGLNEASDVESASPASVLELPAVPTPVPDGVALDRVVSNSLPAFELPCAMTDINGLARPQDGNGDSIFGCDSGAVERQGGPDIGAPQSGAYYAPSRPGEGYFVEMLGDDRVFVTFFTYNPTSEGGPPANAAPRWFFGVGEVVGNSIVVDTFNTAPIGPRFTAFDSADLHINGHSELSLIFADCQSVNHLGRAVFDHSALTIPVPPPFGEPPTFDELYTGLVRLTSVVGCNGEASSTRSGLSGSFFAAERIGEGIVVQWLDEDRAFAAWYTFDLQGQQLWMISDNAVVEGNTVTLEMFYPAVTTGFGANFDPAEIQLEPWGTVTLDYSDCDTIAFSYDSVVEGYGSGSFTYTRLTRPAGTTCSL